jgi:hypothetical protein
LTDLLHPPYSLDLTSSDFQLLGALKDALYGERSDDKVIKEVMKLLQVPNSKWHKKGIDALFSGWWHKKGIDALFSGWCVTTDVDGDYVETWGT